MCLKEREGVRERDRDTQRKRERQRERERERERELQLLLSLSLLLLFLPLLVLLLLLRVLWLLCLPASLLLCVCMCAFARESERERETCSDQNSDTGSSCAPEPNFFSGSSRRNIRAVFLRINCKKSSAELYFSDSSSCNEFAEKIAVDSHLHPMTGIRSFNIALTIIP